jgi:hypothetical protein
MAKSIFGSSQFRRLILMNMDFGMLYCSFMLCIVIIVIMYSSWGIMLTSWKEEQKNYNRVLDADEEVTIVGQFWRSLQ